MSLTSLSINAKDPKTGEAVPFNFSPILNKKGGTTKFIAPLVHAADGSDGSGSAKDLRLMFKAQGVKGRALTEAVNKALREHKTVRQARTLLFLTTAAENGFVTSHIEFNSKGDKFNIVGCKAAEKPEGETTKVRKAKEALEEQKKENAELKAQMEALQKQLAQLAALIPAGATPMPDVAQPAAQA